MAKTRKEKIEQLDKEIVVKRAEYETLRKEYEALEDDIRKTREKLEKLYKKQASGKELTNAELRSKAIYERNLKELEARRAGASTTTTSTANTNTAANKNTKNVGNTAANKNSTKATALENSEQKAQEAADAMNNGNEKKVEDAGSATKTAKEMANTVDANIEENVPTWFWREAREMAPTDKAKRGFLITDYITNRLGTALSNTGAIVQNNGGSGGGQIKEQGGTYIDKYRQSKLDQALANRKAKQNNLLQQQIDALIAIGASENEARAIQNKLRNSKHWNKYNRLTNEQQVYIQGLLYSDTRGKISDAVLGNFIDQLMEGKDISLEQAAATALTAAGIDNAEQMKAGAKNIGDKVRKWLNLERVGD